MTVEDRCTAAYAHPAHRTQYGPFGVKDCPGIPVTPATAPAVPDGPAPASTPPESHLEWTVRNLERQVGRLFSRLDEHLSITHDRDYPADDEDRQAHVQNLLDDSARAFADADSSSERVEVLRDLLAGWYAAWPDTAVTDPNEGIAWQLASMISAAEARASTPAADRTRQQLLDELAGGKRPCPWCTGAPVFDSAEELLTHTRRHHLAPFPPDELVWLGDLSGYQVVTSGGDATLLHRCGWTYPITNPVRGYLANLIDGPVSAHRDTGCNPHEG